MIARKYCDQPLVEIDEGFRSPSRFPPTPATCRASAPPPIARCRHHPGGGLMRAATLPDRAARATALTDTRRSYLVEAGSGSGKTSIMAGASSRR